MDDFDTTALRKKFQKRKMIQELTSEKFLRDTVRQCDELYELLRKNDARAVNLPAGEHLAVSGYDDWQMHETGVEPPPMAMEGNVVIDCEPKQDWLEVARENLRTAKAAIFGGACVSIESEHSLILTSILAELCRLNANLERKP